MHNSKQSLAYSVVRRKYPGLHNGEEIAVGFTDFGRNKSYPESDPSNHRPLLEIMKTRSGAGASTSVVRRGQLAGSDDRFEDGKHTVCSILIDRQPNTRA